MRLNCSLAASFVSGFLSWRGANTLHSAAAAHMAATLKLTGCQRTANLLYARLMSTSLTELEISSTS